MASSRPGEQNGRHRDLHDVKWLDVEPVAGAPELPDEEVPLLDEPPIVTEARSLPGGPYLLAPDSAEQMPTDFLSVKGEDGIRGVIEQAESASNDELTIPEDQRRYLAAGGQAARQLLATLERGLEAATPELEAASIERLSKAGLL